MSGCQPATFGAWRGRAPQSVARGEGVNRLPVRNGQVSARAPCLPSRPRPATSCPARASASGWPPRHPPEFSIRPLGPTQQRTMPEVENEPNHYEGQLGPHRIARLSPVACRLSPVACRCHSFRLWPLSNPFASTFKTSKIPNRQRAGKRSVHPCPCPRSTRLFLALAGRPHLHRPSAMNRRARVRVRRTKKKMMTVVVLQTFMAVL